MPFILLNRVCLRVVLCCFFVRTLDRVEGIKGVISIIAFNKKNMGMGVTRHDLLLGSM